jgi:hypothetical protein
MRSSLLLVGVLVVGGSVAVIGGVGAASGAHVADAGTAADPVTTAQEGPLVDAGLDQTVERDTIVLLDGRGTWSPAGDIVSHEWRITTPNGTELTPEDPMDPQTRFRATTPGRYEVTLRATDETGATGTDTLYVTVETADPPRVSIVGPDRVALDETVTHTANAVAPDGEIERIEWRNGDIGEQSTRRITASPGMTDVLVTVTDDNGRSSTTTKSVLVIASNRGPTARIEGPSRVEQGSTHTFRLGASDPDGTIERIRWANGDSGASTDRTFDDPVGSVVTMRAVVSDDKGRMTTATHAVKIVDQSQDTTGSPTIDVDGPREVVSGSSHRYFAETDHSGDEPVSVRWFGEDFVDQGETHPHEFRRPAGSTVRFTAVGTDPSGATASETVSVTVVSAPRVSIAGLPEDCIQAGRSLSLSADTTSTDSALDYEWRVDGDTVGQGETLTREFTRDGETEITLAATTEDGYTGTTTETVCVDAQNQPPEIQSVSAVWFASTHEDPGVAPVEHDAFSSLVDSRFPLVEFSAAATDPDGEELTYRWTFGDGTTGVTSGQNGEETTISHDYSPAAGQERDRTEFRVTLVVEDERGATTTATRTLSVRKLFGNAGDYKLSADKQRVQVGEEITFTVRNEMTAARHVEGRVVYGNGRYERADSDSSTSQTTTQYNQPGTYTVQFWSGNDKTGHVGLDGQIQITVVEDSYTAYTYGIEERATRVNPMSPGEEWKQGPIDHLERSQLGVRNRTARANSDEARQLERYGYQAVDRRTEQVRVDTQTKRAVSSPGSEWTLFERDVDTVRRQDGWDYAVFDSPHYGSEWSHIKTVRTSEEIRQTTTAATRPSGSGWSRGGSTGRSRTGWDTGWVDSRSSAPSGAQIIDGRRTLVDTDSRHVCVNREQYWGPFGRLHSRCVKTERQVVDRTYDTRYKYRVADYSTVWEWERSRTVYDREYHYRKPNYETVSRSLYQRPVYEQRSLIEYQKSVYTMEAHYEWRSTTVSTQTGLAYPTKDNVAWVESESYNCPNGPFAQEACS